MTHRYHTRAVYFDHEGNALIDKRARILAKTGHDHYPTNYQAAQTGILYRELRDAGTPVSLGKVSHYIGVARAVNAKNVAIQPHTVHLKGGGTQRIPFITAPVPHVPFGIRNSYRPARGEFVPNENSEYRYFSNPPIIVPKARDRR